MHAASKMPYDIIKSGSLFVENTTIINKTSGVLQFRRLSHYPRQVGVIKTIWAGVIPLTIMRPGNASTRKVATAAVHAAGTNYTAASGLLTRNKGPVKAVASVNQAQL